MRWIRNKISHAEESQTPYVYLPMDELPTDILNIVNQAPSTQEEAIITWLLTCPTPSEVFSFLPNAYAEMTALVDLKWGESQLNGLAEDPLNERERQALIDKYPPNKGRPGGKLHVELGGLTIAFRHSALSNKIARWLIKIPVTDWELTHAAALIMLPHTSRTAEKVTKEIFKLQEMGTMSTKDTTKFYKGIHTLIRTTHSLGNLRLSIDEANDVYGIDALVGPSEHLITNAYDEIVMRTHTAAKLAVPVPSQNGALSEEAYGHYFDVALLATIRETLPTTVKWKTFDEWYADRFGWAASGGAPGATLQWVEGKERMNKRGALLVLQQQEVRRVLMETKRPVNFSKAAVKFEKGKTRMIWNTSLYHYLFQAYVLDCLDTHTVTEPTALEGPVPASWNSATHSNSERLAAQASRLAQLGTNGQHGLMWDFSDFNINHDLYSMLKLFARFGSALAAKLVSSGSDTAQIHRDFAACVEHISGARMNTILSSSTVDDDLLVVDIKRSLQSGERATSFTNTYLNRVYIKIAQLVSNDLLGYELIKPSLSQQGDDVFSLVGTITDGVLACTLINLIGAAGQTYKITLDYNGKGEFLRYGYDAINRVVRGYPLRTSLGLLSGEFFMDPIVDPDGRAVAYLEAWQKANLRGAILPRSFLDYLIRNNCFVTFTDNNGVKHRVVGDLEFGLTPKVYGGLGSAGYVGHNFGGNPEVTVGYSNPRPRPLYEPPKFDSTYVFRHVNLVDRAALVKLGMAESLTGTLSKALAASTLTGSYPVSKASEALASYARRLYDWRVRLVRSRHDRVKAVRANVPERNVEKLFLQALGLHSPTNQPHAIDFLGAAVCIPSGHGKTELAKEFPHLFIDHDDYVDHTYVADLVAAKEWDTLNLYHRTARLPRDGRVLLTWSPETCPSGRPVVCGTIVQSASDKPLTKDNVAVLARTLSTKLKVFQDFTTRNSFLCELARDTIAKARAVPIHGNPMSFKPARKVYHAFNGITRYAAACGFSLTEVFTAVIADYPSSSGEGDLGRFFAICEKLIRPLSKPPKHEETTKWLRKHARPGSSNLAYKYFIGDIGWLPPPSLNYPPEVLSLTRDLSLWYLEHYMDHIFSTSEVELITTVHSLELQFLHVFERTITPVYLKNMQFLG